MLTVNCFMKENSLEKLPAFNGCLLQWEIRVESLLLDSRMELSDSYF